MSIFSFLFGDKNPPPVETNGITKRDITKNKAKQQEQTNGTEKDRANEGIVTYTEPRTVGVKKGD